VSCTYLVTLVVIKSNEISF